MRDGHNCTVREVMPQRLLNQIISGCVDGRSSFVKYQDLAFLEQHPTETHELPLSHAPVLTILSNCSSKIIEQGMRQIRF